MTTVTRLLLVLATGIGATLALHHRPDHTTRRTRGAPFHRNG